MGVQASDSEDSKDLGLFVYFTLSPLMSLQSQDYSAGKQEDWSVYIEGAGGARVNYTGKKG